MIYLRKNLNFLKKAIPGQRQEYHPPAKRKNHKRNLTKIFNKPLISNTMNLNLGTSLKQKLVWQNCNFFKEDLYWSPNQDII